MPEESDPRRDVALFRYRVIVEPLSLPRGARERRAAMRAQAARTHSIPGSSRARVAVETIRDWIRLYEQGSFEALHPKPRKDRGRTRRLPPEVVDLLIDIKRREPHPSVRKVVLEAHRTVPDAVLLAPSTVSRLLRREGLTKPAATAAEPKDRRRYAYSRAAEMWQSWERSHDCHRSTSSSWTIPVEQFFAECSENPGLIRGGPGGFRCHGDLIWVALSRSCAVRMEVDRQGIPCKDPSNRPRPFFAPKPDSGSPCRRFREFRAETIRQVHRPCRHVPALAQNAVDMGTGDTYDAIVATGFWAAVLSARTAPSPAVAHREAMGKR